MTSINTNISAIVSQNALRLQSRTMEATMNRLSTGKRVNSGTEDPAALGMISRMESNARVNTQGIKNANDAISMLQTLINAGEQIARIVGRLGELYLAAENDTISQNDEETMNAEGFSLLTEWSRIATNTLWNGTALMSTNQIGGAALTVGLGDAGSNITLALKDWRPQSNDAIGGEGAGSSVNGSAALVGGGSAPFWNLNLTKPNSAGVANTIATDNLLIFADRQLWGGKVALSFVGMSTELAQMGQYMSRLEIAVDELMSASTNSNHSRSKIEDANYAVESSALSKMQILKQAGVAMLAQANQSQQTVLALLQ